MSPRTVVQIIAELQAARDKDLPATRLENSPYLRGFACGAADAYGHAIELLFELSQIPGREEKS